MTLIQYKKYICPAAKECMDELSNWIKEEVTYDELEHVQEWINILEDLYNLTK